MRLNFGILFMFFIHHSLIVGDVSKYRHFEISIAFFIFKEFFFLLLFFAKLRKQFEVKFFDGYFVTYMSCFLKSQNRTYRSYNSVGTVNYALANVSVWKMYLFVVNFLYFSIYCSLGGNQNNTKTDMGSCVELNQSLCALTRCSARKKMAFQITVSFLTHFWHYSTLPIFISHYFVPIFLYYFALFVGRP